MSYIFLSLSTVWDIAFRGTRVIRYFSNLSRGFQELHLRQWRLTKVGRCQRDLKREIVTPDGVRDDREGEVKDETKLYLEQLHCSFCYVLR